MARVATSPLLLLLLFFFLDKEVEGERKCAGKNVYTDNEPQIHCTCNATYCDDFPSLGDFNADEAVVFKSDRYGVRFDRSVLKFKDGVDGGRGSIIVDTGNRRQTMNGFGGAWTDTIALLADKLSDGAKKNLVDTYYSKDWGIGYSLTRVPLASCDFSDRLYSYDETDGDNNLDHFALASEDLDHRIPQLQRAKSVAGDAGLRLLASPWSAPGWMKSNGDMKGAGTLKDPDGGPMWQVYANYILKYFQAYNDHDLQFWGLTPQNEPMISQDPNFWYQAMYFSADMEKRFVRDYLGPTLRGNALTKGINILLLDHNRDLLPDYPLSILQDNQAASYVAGTAVHWYNDKNTSPDKLSQLNNAYPGKFILYTEACEGLNTDQPHHDDWQHTHEYGDSIFDAIAHYATGWTDWNMAVNPSGGPSWVNNVVDAPVYVEEGKDEFHKNGMFYFMGHFSKFVRPGTVAVSWASSGTSVRVAAFVDPNNSDRRVLVIQNQDWGNGVSLSIQDKANPSRSLNLDFGPATIATVIWKKP